LWRAASDGSLRAWGYFVLVYLGVSVLHACWDGIGTWRAFLAPAVISLGLVRRRVREDLLEHPAAIR
jgi:hypothetical protein